MSSAATAALVTATRTGFAQVLRRISDVRLFVPPARHRCAGAELVEQLTPAAATIMPFNAGLS